MKPKQRLILRILALICIISSVSLYAFVQTPTDAFLPLPTLMVLPSLTASHTPTATFTPSHTLTSSATPTWTATATMTPSITPSLSTRVLQIGAVMANSPATPTSISPNKEQVVYGEPPYPPLQLPDATAVAAPYWGWYRFESDHPTIHYEPPWEKRQVREASRGQYHRTDHPQGYASFAFQGAAFRVQYVAAQNMGVFDLVVDGVWLDQIDAYGTERAFNTTKLYTVIPGFHVLEIRGAGQADASTGYTMGLDAIDVYDGELPSYTVAQAEILPPTVTLQAAAKVELISAPPTVQPTKTLLPPKQIKVTVIVAYDENGNKVVDPAEGASGISIRIVETATNRVLTQAFTDTSGYAALEVITDQTVRVVAPYFGKTWDIRRGNTAQNTTFTLLLTPGNQPGLIP